jgi:arsenite/tail-anchored protein-transporting ATPase
VPQLAFFLGKGGVGKTTVSTAYAVHCARRNKSERILLISTDPAHSLSDILQRKLTSRVSSVGLTRGRQVQVWQVDSVRLFGKFLAKYREQILSVIDSGAIFSRGDIEPLIDSALPGMAEVSALLAVHEALKSGRYERIVIDTAPFGHTLRLFELPAHFRRFLDFLELAASRDRVLAAHFGGQASTPAAEFLADWRALAEGLFTAFGKTAELFLVTTPENFSLQQSVRSMAELVKSSPEVTVGGVVLNRVVVRQSSCPICRERIARSKAARRFVKREFPNSRLLIGEDQGSPVMGIESLASFGEHVFEGKTPGRMNAPRKSASIKFRPVLWPTVAAPLSFVLGKGGVGKTTISAALALHARRDGQAAVDICSVDPAPSLDDVFEKNVGDAPTPVLGDSKLRACELDSVALFREWVGRIRASIDDATSAQVSGIHIDLSFERQLLSALLEIVPPGVDEVLATFRIVDLLSRPGHHVIIDMAPTGHALELLRMPERILAWTRPLLKTLAAHRTLALAQDAAVQIAGVGQRARELTKVLEDCEATNLHIVMLAEPLPDRETERLLSDLRELKLTPSSLFVNRVLFAEDVGDCRRCRRAMDWQHTRLAKLKERYSVPSVYVVRNFSHEISGKAGLRSFTGELWQLA